MQNEREKNEYVPGELSAKQMRAILDTAVEGIITIDDAGVVLTFNKAAEFMFGYAKGEVIGHNVSMLMPLPHQRDHDSYLHNYHKTGEKRIIGIGREVSGLHKNGNEFPIELSVAEVVVNKETTFAGVVRDITERKTFEQALKQKESQLAHLDRVNLIGEMAAGIAHEINQPLTAITTYAQACKRMLDMENASQAELVSALDQVSAQVDRAGEVIRRIRSMAKGAQGTRELMSVNGLIEDTVPLVLLNRGARNKNIELELQESLPAVEIDCVQFQQVLLNLAGNAFDAMEDTGSIVIRSERIEDDVCISVSDTGPGVEAEVDEQIYHPFFTTKSEHSGMGMGLAICQSIVSAHNGRLWHKSNREAGVTFSFSLPIALSLDDE